MTRVAASLVLLACLGVGGCSLLPMGASSSPQPVASPMTSPEAPTMTPAPPSEREPAQASACDPEVADAALSVVRSQQEAFAEGDFAAARQLASASFRTFVSLREFQAIIEQGYPFLLDDPEVSLTQCLMVGSVAVLRISVQAQPAVGLAYRLVEEDGAWRIDGASRLQEMPA